MFRDLTWTVIWRVISLATFQPMTDYRVTTGGMSVICKYWGFANQTIANQTRLNKTWGRIETCRRVTTLMNISFQEPIHCVAVHGDEVITGSTANRLAFTCVDRGGHNLNGFYTHSASPHDWVKFPEFEPKERQEFKRTTALMVGNLARRCQQQKF